MVGFCKALDNYKIIIILVKTDIMFKKILLPYYTGDTRIFSPLYEWAYVPTKHESMQKLKNTIPLQKIQ